MNRKLVILSYLVIFCLGIFPGIVFASSSENSSTRAFTEDWAYHAIESLGQNRQVPGFSMPTEMSRNQGALLLARLLQHLTGEDHLESRRFGVSKNVYLDSMIFAYNQRATPELALNASQVESLYRLVLEFNEELEILGYAIQDFNILYEQTRQKSYDGLLAKRPLLYSDQAIAAARKLADEYAQQSKTFLTHRSSLTQEKELVSELVPIPIEPKNLWTGQFASPVRYLPPTINFLAQQPQVESNSGIQIGGLEVSGGFRPVLSGAKPLENSPSTEGGAGYGVSVKLGDFALQTAVDHFAVDQSLAPKVTSTSVGFSLDWADLFLLSAGYKQLDVPKELEDWKDVKPIETSLGVEVPITRGKVSLGMTQEWGKSDSLAGDKNSNDELAKSTAEVGLTYEFKNDSSMRFNYRFIDFSNVDYGASAEFSIKF